METQINNFRANLSCVRQKTDFQLKSLLAYFTQSLAQLGDRIAAKLDSYGNTIEENIIFYDNLLESTPAKAHFGSSLFAQLSWDVSIVNVEVEEDGDKISPQLPQQSPQISKCQQQLQEVHQILKKAVFLFSDQYANAISGLPTNLTKFADRVLEFPSDLQFAQDKCHASFGSSSCTSIEEDEPQQQEESASTIIEEDTVFSEHNHQQQQQQPSSSDSSSHLSCKFLKEVNLSAESPSYLPRQYSYSAVKCFAVLDDHRRGVLCTRNHILLVDLTTCRVIKASELRGLVPMLPTCIQPLYSYEDLTVDSLSVLFGDSVTRSSHNIFTEEVKLGMKQQQAQQRQRERKQTLVAVGMGNLSSSIDICVYSIRTLERVLQLPGHTRTICKMIQLPLDYSTLLSISSDRRIFVWNLTKGIMSSVIDTEHTQSVNDAAVVSDTQIATYSLNGEIFLWEASYTTDNNSRSSRRNFVALKRISKISRQCLSLYIGQLISRSELAYFCVTSHGITEQKYFLELNWYSKEKETVKKELQHKVVGLNVVMADQTAFAIVQYQLQNFFDVYAVPTLGKLQEPVLEQRVYFPSPDHHVSNVIESPRLQFSSVSKRKNGADKLTLLAYIALDQHIYKFELQLKKKSSISNHNHTQQQNANEEQEKEEGL